MDKKSIIKEINNVLKEHNLSIKLDEKTMTQNFKDLGADSLSLLEIIISIENKLNISLPDNELMNVKNANDLIELISKNLK